ncbi:MAG: hypothetical protein KDK03_16895 [Rhodobacteraceae bacterium]|nr:hypothetical protein [Paracoccaceae bacterium]
MEASLRGRDAAGLAALLRAVLAPDGTAAPPLAEAAEARARRLPRPEAFLTAVLAAVVAGAAVDLDALAEEAGATGREGLSGSGTDWQRFEAVLTGAAEPAPDTDLAAVALGDPERLARLVEPQAFTAARLARLARSSRAESLAALVERRKPGFAARESVVLALLWDCLPAELPAQMRTRAALWDFTLLAAFDAVPVQGGLTGLAAAAVAHLAPETGARRTLVHALATRLTREKRSHVAAAELLAALRRLPGGQAPAEAGASGETRLQITRSAGLVLLAPYLPMLFSRLELLSQNRLRDGAAIEMALDALHTLASGDAELPGDALPLERLLCAVPEGLELRPPAPLADPGRRALADGLLRAVIAEWGALGQTSPDGLRAAFLRRDGQLSAREGGLRLDVAPAAYDMLLDRLPWSFALVKLPWMVAPLHVKWRERT